jgi:dephospho-CoA kinase
MLISLSGKKSSGKSTVAKFLVSKGFEIRSFAGPLKEMVSEAFGLPMHLLTDAEAKEKHALSIYIQPLHIIRMATIANAKFYKVSQSQLDYALANVPSMLITTPRQLLQVVGTEVFRNHVAEDYWLKAFKASLPANKDIVCDDARFKNEQDLIKELGGYTIGIERPGLYNLDNHASEKIDLSNCDFVLQNKYTLKVLESDIETTYSLIKELAWQKAENAVKPNPSEPSSETKRLR